MAQPEQADSRQTREGGRPSAALPVSGRPARDAWRRGQNRGEKAPGVCSWANPCTPPLTPRHSSWLPCGLPACRPPAAGPERGLPDHPAGHRRQGRPRHLQPHNRGGGNHHRYVGRAWVAAAHPSDGAGWQTRTPAPSPGRCFRVCAARCRAATLCRRCRPCARSPPLLQPSPRVGT